MPASLSSTLSRGRSVLLPYGLISWEGPVLVEQQFVFTSLLGDDINLQIFVEVHTGLSRGGYVEVAVTIEASTTNCVPAAAVPLTEIGMRVNVPELRSILY